MTATTTSVRHDGPGPAPPVTPLAPPVVYLLAEHLDSVLARGEDLIASGWRPAKLPRCAHSIAELQGEQRRAIDQIAMLELSLVSRALKARERSRELAARDNRFSAIARLFAAGTAALADAAAELGDSASTDFDTADGVVAYMRSRGLVAPDAALVDDCGTVVVTPAFLVARRIALGPLLDLVAAYLDALEIHFELFSDAPSDSMTAAPETGTAVADVFDIAATSAATD